jgi:hypothetical protein
MRNNIYNEGRRKNPIDDEHERKIQHERKKNERKKKSITYI